MEHKLPPLIFCKDCGLSHYKADPLCLTVTSQVAPVTTGPYTAAGELMDLSKDNDVILMIVSIGGQLRYVRQTNRKGTTTMQNIDKRVQAALVEAMFLCRNGVNSK